MTVSLIGDGVMLIALAWQVFALSNTPSALAIVGRRRCRRRTCCSRCSGGVASDRFDRRRVMIGADAVRGARARDARRVVDRRDACSCGISSYSARCTGRLRVLRARVRRHHPRPRSHEPPHPGQLARPVHPTRRDPAHRSDARGISRRRGRTRLGAHRERRDLRGVDRVHPAHARSSPAAHPGEPHIAHATICASSTGSCATRVWLWGTLLSSSIACLLFLGPSEVLLPYLVKHDMHASASTLGVVFAFGGLGAVSRRGVRRAPRPARSGTSPSSMSCGPPRRCPRVLRPRPLHLAAHGRVLRVQSRSRPRGSSAGPRCRQRLVPRHLLGHVSSLDWFVATGLTPISFALVGPLAAGFRHPGDVGRLRLARECGHRGRVLPARDACARATAMAFERAARSEEMVPTAN